MEQIKATIEHFKAIAHNAYATLDTSDNLQDLPEELHNIIQNKDSDKLREHFDTSDTFADSVKVTTVT